MGKTFPLPHKSVLKTSVVVNLLITRNLIYLVGFSIECSIKVLQLLDLFPF